MPKDSTPSPASFSRLAAIALVAGLAMGGALATYTLGSARLGSDIGVAGGTSFARFVGNDRATGSAATGLAKRCIGCRDSYDIVYLNHPGRERMPVRLSERRLYDYGGGANATDFADAAVLDSPDAPIEPLRRAIDKEQAAARTAERQARMAALTDRMARARAQVARALAETADMHGEPVPTTPSVMIRRGGVAPPAPGAVKKVPATTAPPLAPAKPPHPAAPLE